MIAIIPYQTFEIKTRLSQDGARQKLQAVVEPRKLLRLGLSRNHNLFEGEIEGASFKISRIIHYRNSFLPILVGQIQDDLDATTLKITARLHWFIIVIWSFFAVAVVSGGILAGDRSELWAILPIFLFFYVVPLAAFNFELHKAQKLLNEQFAADRYSLL
ncbi:MAG: hypothetical protein IT327_17875 [Anaerolineae bacterium]|nr:hypothetical protein [Anaerolineae bacterium]